MIKHLVALTVPGATEERFYDFMIDPNTEKYHAWWPEEHLRFELVRRGGSAHLGDEVFYDELVGENHKLAFRAIVTTANRPGKLVWQMKKAGVSLPARLCLEFCDAADGLRIRHELKTGFSGIGKMLDPFLRLYINKSFLIALEKHCRIEWPKLAEYLNSGAKK